MKLQIEVMLKHNGLRQCAQLKAQSDIMEQTVIYDFMLQDFGLSLNITISKRVAAVKIVPFTLTAILLPVCFKLRVDPCFFEK